MIQIKSFPFNPFQMNTYLLWDETGEAIVIDAGMLENHEKETFLSTLQTENLKLVANYHTHCHIDHIAGDDFIRDEFDLLPIIQPEGEFLLERAKEQAMIFGFQMGDVVKPGSYIHEGEPVKFGNSELEVLYTPGHADGSICFYSATDKFVVVGDVLFRDGIGRTDLPSGNFDLLAENIREKLYTLPDDVVVYSGHGPSTTIGHEKQRNPYVRPR
jgi:glyoxylase-like metal-dependent hydrolase (beta-lactamase superfamily II)